MFIHATRSYEFKGKGGATFKTEPLSVVDAPDWIIDDPLFAWCVKDGTIKTVDRDKTVVPVAKTVETVIETSDSVSVPAEPEKKRKPKS